MSISARGKADLPASALWDRGLLPLLLAPWAGSRFRLGRPSADGVRESMERGGATCAKAV